MEQVKKDLNTFFGPKIKNQKIEFEKQALNIKTGGWGILLVISLVLIAGLTFIDQSDKTGIDEFLNGMLFVVVIVSYIRFIKITGDKEAELFNKTFKKTK